MSSIFSKIRSSLGLESKTESRGHVLGTRESPPSKDESAGTKVFEVCFEEEKMGMQVEAAEGGLPLITRVFEDSSAHRHRIRPGDLIIAIDNLEINSYDHCMGILRDSGRPINLRFKSKSLCLRLLKASWVVGFCELEKAFDPHRRQYRNH